MDFPSLLNLLLLILGFGFVIFWHELGHFLAAKWAGVKVEQFAVGFGQAVLCWRKGIGLRVGTTRPEYERRAREQLDRQAPANLPPRAGDDLKLDYAARDIGLGETEYRLNWIPLGGYVKMLGQDDMNPNSSSPDPRAYNNKSVGQRMVIISAGVIMNVILAGILFCVLFLWGFRAPSPVVGGVQAGSPAQQAGLMPGDRVLRIDGTRMHDFTKIKLATALASPDEPSQMIVVRDGKETALRVMPVRDASEGGFLQIGVAPSGLLRVPEGFSLRDENPELAAYSDALRSAAAGDRVVAINGIPVGQDDSDPARDRDWAIFQEQLQQSFGQPVEITLRSTSGHEKRVALQPRFDRPFGRLPLHFAGLQPRTQVSYIVPESDARGRILPGDAVARVRVDATGDAVDHPSQEQFLRTIEQASARGSTISITTQRGEDLKTHEKLKLAVRLERPFGRDVYGLGVGPSVEETRVVLASPLPDSPAARSGLRAGQTIVEIDGNPVRTWFDVHRILASAPTDRPIEITASIDGDITRHRLAIGETDLAGIRAIQYTQAELPLEERTEIRKTTNPAEALWWGVTETRDLIVQFYVVLKRMLIQQTVSASSMSGPVGILHHGARIASRGPDWMIWYLAMISANLAVVNFLPLPIVDGGHFVFLLLEKIRGRPVSPRVMVVTQLIGLALIVGIFLFVTYNDIIRLL